MSAPTVKPGSMDRFLCLIHSPGNFNRQFVRPLLYANAYLMPLHDNYSDQPECAVSVNGEDDLSWTGWFEEFCDTCEIQMVFSGKVIAWIPLPETPEAFEALAESAAELTRLRAVNTELAATLHHCKGMFTMCRDHFAECDEDKEALTSWAKMCLDEILKINYALSAHKAAKGRP
jgi:hypothetical protein